jgi:2-iminobutanoate/2-iminopropanoate deaminase
MSTTTFQRQIIATPDAPAAIGPYSQAVLVTGGRTLYCSGQIPLDPESGELVGGDDIRAQTERVLDNLQAVLEAAGMGFENVVRCGIFLADMGDFAVVNGIYATRFASDPPARATVQVAVLPKNVRIEIDAIAVAP